MYHELLEQNPIAKSPQNYTKYTINLLDEKGEK